MFGRFGEHFVKPRDVSDQRLLIRVWGINIFRIQKTGNTEVFVGNMEGIFQIFSGSTSATRTVIEKIRSVTMQNGIEEQAIPPTLSEVGNSNAWISFGSLLCPSEERFFERLGVVV